jgi:hypothetical protein
MAEQMLSSELEKIFVVILTRTWEVKYIPQALSKKD